MKPPLLAVPICPGAEPTAEFTRTVENAHGRTLMDLRVTLGPSVRGDTLAHRWLIAAQDLWQDQGDTWERHQQTDHHAKCNHEWRRAEEDVVDTSTPSQTLDHEQGHADRWRDHRNLDEENNQNAEPDRVEAERSHDGLDDRHGGDHHRQRFHEGAEEQIECDNDEQRLIRAETQ